jgi:hypothetical protein
MSPDMDPLENARKMVERLDEQQQRLVLRLLRDRYPIHPLEAEWDVPAEVVLEAIGRAPDLSQRGVRGLIAEAFFKYEVIDRLADWEDDTPEGNHPFDFRIKRHDRQVRIQVKNQRLADGKPMSAYQAYRHLSADKYVAETQRSRRGIDPATGRDTRPYRFGEFDILAVCMKPATGDWSQFRFTLERWLLARPEDASQLLKFQPVSLEPDDDWTDSLEDCITWFHSGVQKRISV